MMPVDKYQYPDEKSCLFQGDPGQVRPPKPSCFWAKKEDEILQHPLFRLLFECHAATGPIDPAEVNSTRAAVHLGMALGILKIRYRNLLDVMKTIERDEKENKEAEKYVCEYETDTSCGDVDSWSDDTFAEVNFVSGTVNGDQHVSHGKVVVQNDIDQEFDEGDEETKTSIDGSDDSDEGDEETKSSTEDSDDSNETDSDYVYNKGEDEDDDMD